MSKKDYITFKTKKNNEVKMNKETFARWLCLMEAFYIIDKKAEDLGINLTDKDIIKPLAYEKYVQQRFESMMLDLTHDEKNNLLGQRIINPYYDVEQDLIVPTVS